MCVPSAASAVVDVKNDKEFETITKLGKGNGVH